MRRRERSELDNDVLPPDLKHVDQSTKAPTSVSAGRDAIVNSVVKFVRANTEYLLGLFMALALIEGAALFYEWRHKAQQNELARANFADWQAFNFNPWVAKVEAHDVLINAALTKQTIQENCKR